MDYLFWRRLGVASLALFLLLTIIVATGVLRTTDSTIMAAVQDRLADLLAAPAQAVSIAGSAEATLLLAGLVAFRLWRLGYGLAALVPLAFVLTTPVELLAKHTVPQLPVTVDTVRIPFPYPFLTYSAPGPFPSGHAARAAFWVAVGLPWLLKSGQTLPAVALVGYGFFSIFARVILGQHWPTDVVGGAFLGLCVGFLAVSFLRRESRIGQSLPIAPSSSSREERARNDAHWPHS